jgi:hypothetical protein
MRLGILPTKSSAGYLAGDLVHAAQAPIPVLAPEMPDRIGRGWDKYVKYIAELPFANVDK